MSDTEQNAKLDISTMATDIRISKSIDYQVLYLQYLPHGVGLIISPVMLLIDLSLTMFFPENMDQLSDIYINMNKLVLEHLVSRSNPPFPPTLYVMIQSISRNNKEVIVDIFI